MAQEPSFEDFLWASSVFWSRAQSLPTPVLVHEALAPAATTASGTADPSAAVAPASTGADADGAAVATGSASASNASGIAAAGNGAGRSRVRIVVQEGLVPGIDFCNHSQQVGGDVAIVKLCVVGMLQDIRLSCLHNSTKACAP